MRKKIFISCILLFAGYLVQAQNLRLNVYAGYVFDDSFDSDYDYSGHNGYSGKISGGLQWGVGLEYMMKPSYGLELSYLRQDTKAPTDYFQTNTIGGYKHT